MGAENKLFITKENVGNQGFVFGNYRKKVITRAVQMDDPFTVKTKEGELTCSDGYLALDSEGWPYPISRGDFEAMYEPSQPEPGKAS